MRHSFSIILIMCILMATGLAVTPRLDIGNEPRPEQGKTLTISFRWSGASAKVVEQNVTSRIEAMAASVRGVESVTSVSKPGSGNVKIQLKPQTDVSIAKFEISSLLRQIRSKLPEDISYPAVSGGEVDASQGDDNEVKLLLTYQLNADMSGEQMKQIAERQTIHGIEHIEGVHHVDISGTTTQYMEIAYDAEIMSCYGIKGSDLADAVKSYAGRESVVGEVRTENGKNVMPVILTSKATGRRFEEMPLTFTGGKTVYLNNIANCTLREQEPDSYYRVNGMNTIYINVYADRDANIMSTADKVKKEIGNAAKKDDTLTRLHPLLVYDRAEIQTREFRTLVIRSALTMAILLLFVWFAGGRQWSYLFIITVCLAANVLIATLVCWMLNIRLHPMSIAGVTVSFGIIIDSTIVMVDHYGYYRNRKAFLGILAAMLTTIGSLMIVFRLPDYLRHDLRDFSVVVIISLAVAIIVALFFAPALVESMRYDSLSKTVRRTWRTRITVRLTMLYRRYVAVCQKPSGRAAILLLLACMFCGSLKLFTESLDRNTFQPKEQEKRLYIRAEMPMGGSVKELNGKVKEVEAFLSQFKGIKRYESSIRLRGASITVEFTEESLKGAFPYMLENRVIGKLITIGGADWATSGVSERGFSNSLNLQYRANSIEIAGYDYERLFRYAEDMCQEMRRNDRITDLAIVTPNHEQQEDEFYMDYDHLALIIDSISATEIHSSLQSILAERDAGEVGHMQFIVRPATTNSFDLWKLRNSYINIHDNMGGHNTAHVGTSSLHNIRPSDFMSITRREAKNVIPRENQEYVLRIAFNVLGSYTYASRYIKQVTEKYNRIFPIGFRCIDRTWGAHEDDGTQYWLASLVAVIIFWIIAVLFENIMQALAITLLIPVSFTGLFLTYYFTGVPFGTGGFAAMVLLEGLTVNAGIYILCQYNSEGNSGGKTFVKAVNHKIIPILLTDFSTILGMIPFLIDGYEEQPFWYSLATGTIGGLAVNILGLLFALPPLTRAATTRQENTLLLP